MDRNIRKSRVKSSQAIKVFEDARKKGLGNIIKDLDFNNNDKGYERLSDKDYEKYLVEERKGLDAFIVNDNSNEDESSEDDIMQTGNRFAKFSFNKKRSLMQPSKPESMTTPKKMSRLYSRNKSKAKTVDITMNNKSDDALDNILNDIDKKNKSTKKYSSYKIQNYNDQIEDDIESRKETFHFSRRNFDNEKTPDNTTFKSSIKERSSENMMKDRLMCNNNGVYNDDMVLDIANAIHDINDHKCQKYKGIKIEEERSIKDSKYILNNEEINDKLNDSRDNDVNMANAMTHTIINDNDREKEEENVMEIKKEEGKEIETNPWQRFKSDVVLDSNSTMKEEEEIALDLNEEENVLSFFILDATEEISTPGVVYFFGKIYDSFYKKYCSCCLRITNVNRTIFVIPKKHIFYEHINTIDSMELDAKLNPDKKIELMNFLHKLCIPLKNEIKMILSKNNINDQIKIKPVKRNYAFEENIPHGMQYVLKVQFPGSKSFTTIKEEGEHFLKIFGINQSLLDSVILKRGIKGPSWMSIKNPVLTEKQNQRSWCNKEYSIPSYKSIVLKNVSMSRNLSVPNLKLVSISIKTIINPKTHINEVVMISLICVCNFKCDEPISDDKWINPNNVKCFTGISKMSNQPWPSGFEEMVEKKNKEINSISNVIVLHQTERSLLNYILAKLTSFDPDIYIGHNITAFDLIVILNRMQHNKAEKWSRIGRLKRNKFMTFKDTQSKAGLYTIISGRLICDTYSICKEMLREVDYTLSTLSGKLLNKKREEIEMLDVAKMYDDAGELIKLVQHTEYDTELSLRLAFHLSMLQLTKQLSDLSGSLWNKALQGQRALRVEMLLNHEFHRRKYILPDKNIQNNKMKMMEDNEMNINSSKQGPKYAGGLVLEPKKGLYDRFVLLLDFNSLYPSIIQEFNICFTTLLRPAVDGQMAELPKVVDEIAPLPLIIKDLIFRRRQVKREMPQISDPILKKQLEIREKAIKLTANSIYGCLGFSNSRYHCKSMAELITFQGRNILQNTVELVEQQFGLQVIYGDTDSIMIMTERNDYQLAMQIGRDVKKEINKNYKVLEIGIDGIFKSLLLLKKKKYAAIKLKISPGNEVIEELEQKGLDMVRRDWCPLIKTVGHVVLKELLSGKNNIIEAIHAYLSDVRKQVVYNKLPLSEYVITKQLAKPLEQYSDYINLPHVFVAMRRKAQGYRHGTRVNETVPYVICDQFSGESDARTLANRSYHPNEVEEKNGLLTLDFNYYLTQQIHPCISRLCAPIPEINDSTIAECLGLDPSKYCNNETSDIISNNKIPFISNEGIFIDSDIFKNCEKIKLKNVNGEIFEFCGVFSILNGSIDVRNAFKHPNSIDDGNTCLNPEQIANQITIQCRQHLRDFYNASSTNTEEYNSNEMTLITDILNDNKLYLQLLYMENEMNIWKNNGHAIDIYQDMNSEEFIELQRYIEPSFNVINTFKNRCSSGFVDMNSLFN